MIEQIYTFFTLEMSYLWLNLGILPFWLVMIFFPNSQIARIFVTSIFPILILSLAYTYLLFITYLDGYDFIQNFKLYFGFGEIQNLFENQFFSSKSWIEINPISGSINVS